jgi:hypothetical protein
VQEQYGKAQRTQKQAYDRRSRHYNFDVGDLVWLYGKANNKKGPYKLACRWDGPYEVRKKLSNVLYVIGQPGQRKTLVINVARLQPYNQRREHLQTVGEDPNLNLHENRGESLESEHFVSNSNEQHPVGFLPLNIEHQRPSDRPQRSRRPPHRLDGYDLENDE